MKLARIDEAIEVCDKHLQSSGATGTPIEAFLTRYLMVLMYASFEEHIEKLVQTRAAKSQDAELGSFVCSALGQLFRSVKTSEIAGLLGRFGQDYKERFQDEMKKNERAETFFNNIVASRHYTAHMIGSNLTFSELVRFYSEGHVVLDAVKMALEST